MMSRFAGDFPVVFGTHTRWLDGPPIQRRLVARLREARSRCGAWRDGSCKVYAAKHDIFLNIPSS
jgi:hypothetical protein